MADNDKKIQELMGRIEQNKKMRDKAIQLRGLLNNRNGISQCETEIKEYQKYIDYFSEELHKLQAKSAHRVSGSTSDSIHTTSTSSTLTPTTEPGTPTSDHHLQHNSSGGAPPRTSSMVSSSSTSATVVSPSALQPSGTVVPRKRYTNLDLLTTATPYNKPKVSLKLHELEYKLDVEKQMLSAIKNMADLFERDPSGDRKRRSEVQGQLYESIEKLNLLKKALRKYKDLYIDEGDEDDDEVETPPSARLPPGLRRPITGKLLMEIVEARELVHAPSRMIENPSTVVIIKIDNNVVYTSRPSRTDRWFDQCEINVNKASEIEVSLYDQSPDRTSTTDRVSLPIGVFWLKISDVVEGLRRRKVQQENGGSRWVSAEQQQQQQQQQQQEEGGNDGTLDHHSSSPSTATEDRLAIPPSQQKMSQSNDGIEAWFEIEPLGKIALRLNFVRETTAGNRPLDRLGRAGAVRQRKEEVHEINGHQFVEKKFYNIMKCALCSDFLVKSGYQCEDCEYTCHPDCYGKVVTKCISKTTSEKDSDEDKLNHKIPHRFEPITNIGGNWCCHCGYMLPLGSRNARKCSECSITCHAKCAHLVPDFCGLSMKMANQMLAEIKAAKRKTLETSSTSSKPKQKPEHSSSDLSPQLSQMQIAPSPQPLPPPKTPPILHQPAPPLQPIQQGGSPTLSPHPQQQQQQHQHQQQQYQHQQQQQRPVMPGPPPMVPMHGAGQSPQPGYPFPQPQHQYDPRYQQQRPPQFDPRYSPQHQRPPPQVYHHPSQQQIDPRYPPMQQQPHHSPPPQQPYGQSIPSPYNTQPIPNPPMRPPQSPGGTMVPAGYSPMDACPPLKQQPSSTGPPRKIGLDSFNFLSVLGKGNFGKVMLAEDKADTNNLYAIKVLKKRFIIDNDEIESVRSEKRVFQAANRERHPFLIGLHSSFQTESRVYFVMEYVSGGDLMWHIQREPFSERRAKYYACEVLLALEYFHSQNIIYRDLKLDNIMLGLDGHIKIADYGLCKENMGYGQVTGTFCGTPEFMAPEILLEQKYGRAVDWWAYGVLIYEMLLGQSPFRGEDEDEIFDAILEDEILYPINMSRDSVGICQRLLTRDPERRLGSGPQDANEIKQHPFFRGVNWDDMLAKRVPPPFYPTITDRLDTSNFDEEFTKERVALTPIDANMTRNEQIEFQAFSYVADWAPQGRW
ncbi:hypothetical protein BC941DRAFT_399152 [Chlamydoabsidia padenii]|nr:hypothetical protein BC941DRAFT_399152 [Chlamydoabsidia padenii]